MINTKSNFEKTDKTFKKPSQFSRYMTAQINEIKQFLDSVPSEFDRNKMAIIWIKEHASQFRSDWKNIK